MKYKKGGDVMYYISNNDLKIDYKNCIVDGFTIDGEFYDGRKINNTYELYIFNSNDLKIFDGFLEMLLYCNDL